MVMERVINDFIFIYSIKLDYMCMSTHTKGQIDKKRIYSKMCEGGKNHFLYFLTLEGWKYFISKINFNDYCQFNFVNLFYVWHFSVEKFNAKNWEINCTTCSTLIGMKAIIILFNNHGDMCRSWCKRIES